MMIRNLLTLSSLEKVFPDQRPEEYAGKFSMMQEDQLAFQLAFRLEAPPEASFWRMVRVKIDSPLAPWLKVFCVRCVPARFLTGNASDGNFLRTEPGLYPDLLLPVGEEGARFTPNCWNAFWFQVRTDASTPAGVHPVKITLMVDSFGETEEYEQTVEVEVIGACLPKQKLLHTEWFHADCIADYYKVPAWSEEHWKAVESQLRAAVRCGVNMILTPVFTPALDTAVGWERTTVQLVDITVEKGAYSFGFEKLDRWVKLCLDCGIERFEIAHLYSQWGAEHCPKIMATVDGEYRRIFGWESDAVGPEYAGFLNAFLPALTAHLEELGLRKEQIVFHISDEPSADHLPQYKACREQVQGLLEGYTIMDALSDFSYYQQGVCPNPVVATNHVTPFLEHKVENLWVYYCVSQNYQVSNRFMAMPSARTRIIGTQFYKYRIAGFLHWGFNFYNSQYSLKHIDPFAVTDADGAFPAGDPFLVYPGEGGEAWDSLRLQVFYDAICDLRAFELLESLAGREFVMELLEGGLQREITFFDYPHEASYLLTLRARVNEEIKKRIGG